MIMHFQQLINSNTFCSFDPVRIGSIFLCITTHSIHTCIPFLALVVATPTMLLVRHWLHTMTFHHLLLPCPLPNGHKLSAPHLTQTSRSPYSVGRSLFTPAQPHAGQRPEPSPLRSPLSPVACLSSPDLSISINNEASRTDDSSAATTTDQLSSAQTGHQQLHSHRRQTHNKPTRLKQRREEAE